MITTMIKELYATWVIHPWVCFGIGLILASLVQETFNGIVKVIWALRAPRKLQGKPEPEIWEDIS